jgi:hypothetical protein
MRAIGVVIGAVIDAVIATRASAIIYLFIYFLVLAGSLRPWEGSSYSHRLLEGSGWYFL